MKLATLHGYEIHQPTSGGKAGKGCNKTSTVQVRRGGCVVKQIRYSTTLNSAGQMNALGKAKTWIVGQAAARGTI